MVTEETGPTLTSEKADARFFGIGSAIVLGLYLIVPIGVIKVLSLLCLVAFAWKLIFHGSTYIALCLHGKRRALFQIAVSIIFPISLSLLFLAGSSPASVAAMFSQLLNGWFLMVLLFIWYVSNKAVDLIDVILPFRSFFIASTILFVICLMGHTGVELQNDDYTDGNVVYQDSGGTNATNEPGRYFGQFIVYVLVSYGGMLWGLRKEHT